MDPIGEQTMVKKFRIEHDDTVGSVGRYCSLYCEECGEILNLEDISDPPDLPEGNHDGWGHFHILLTCFAWEWVALQSQASNKAVLGFPEKSHQ